MCLVVRSLAHRTGHPVDVVRWLCRYVATESRVLLAGLRALCRPAVVVFVLARWFTRRCASPSCPVLWHGVPSIRRRDPLPPGPVHACASDGYTDYAAAPHFHWGACGPMLVYQMGIAASLLDLGGDAAGYLRRCRLTGASGGAATAGYMFAALRGVGTMDYWYHQHVRGIAHPSRPLYHLSHVIWSLAMAYHEICTARSLSFDDGGYGLYTSGPGRTARYRDRFPSSYHFAEDLAAGAFVPFITGMGVAYGHRDGYQLDGAWAYQGDGSDVAMTLSSVLPPDLANNPVRLLWRMYRATRDVDVLDGLYEQGKRWGRENGPAIVARCSLLVEGSCQPCRPCPGVCVGEVERTVEDR